MSVHVGITSNAQAIGFAGLLGLSQPIASLPRETPQIVSALTQSTAMSNGLIAVQIPRANDFGQLTIEADISSIGVRWIQSQSSTAWVVPIADVIVDGRSLGLGPRSAIVDTGGPDIVAPPADAAMINSALSTLGTADGKAVIPCSSTYVLQLSINGQLITVTPKDYVGQQIGSGMCRIFASNNTPPWSLGDAFLANVEMVMD